MRNFDEPKYKVGLIADKILDGSESSQHFICILNFSYTYDKINKKIRLQKEKDYNSTLTYSVIYLCNGVTYAMVWDYKINTESIDTRTYKYKAYVKTYRSKILISF